jgi:hypothetical protein
MRIRQIKPAFWTDKVMAGLPFRTRLVYVGLWQLADDAGWLLWDVSQAGAELLPFESARARERWLSQDMDRLVTSGRLVSYSCGHVAIPTLSEHQRFGGRPVFTIRDAHARGCARVSADAHNGRERNVKVGNGNGLREQTRNPGYEGFKETGAALGLTAPDDTAQREETP